MALMRTRVIPVLLLKDNGLVKTVKFKKPRYIGDPINSVKIFNEKEVDELAFLDITASTQKRGPDYSMLEWIAGEAFMPMAYGGGVTTLEQVHKILGLGFEKVIINTAAFSNIGLIKEATKVFGAQAIVGCVDVSKSLLGKYVVHSHCGTKKSSVKLDAHLDALLAADIGEVIIQSIDRDGQMAGYDLALIKTASEKLSVPVVALGGGGTLDHIVEAVKEGGASAVAAGSMFVYQGVHRAVLINYPERKLLESRLP